MSLTSMARRWFSRRRTVILASGSPRRRELLDLTGITKAAEESAKQLAAGLKAGVLSDVPTGARSAQIGERWAEKFDAVVKSDDYLKPYVAFYAKRFSHEEILDLLRFFETPPGQHFAKEIPPASASVAMTMQVRLRREADRILREMREEFPELKRP